MMKRFFSFLFTLILIFMVSRMLIRALPGDPLQTLLAESGSRVDAALLSQELGLDRPWFSALVQDAGRALRGDWGKSLLNQQEITPLLIHRFSETLKLTALTLILGLSLSLTLGLSAATRHHTAWGNLSDQICSYLGAIAAALPTPWLGPVLIYLFAVQIQIFDLGGSLWLPAITLSIGFTGFWSRLIRERVSEVLHGGGHSNAANAARARGIPEWKIAIHYGLAPASGGLLAFLGTHLGALLSGAFVTEVIFNRSGLGRLLVDAVLSRDYPLVEASIFWTSAIALAGTFLGDWGRDCIDPRKSNWERAGT